jgi:hypothetical protein
MGFLFLLKFVQENMLLGTSLLSLSRFFSSIFFLILFIAISTTLILHVQTEAFIADIQSTVIGFL